MTIEQASVFACGAESLVGVLSAPTRPAGDVGVLIVVGGPQVRAGSHRQFVLLARYLAAAGFPSFRFDVRGMGDSTGPLRSFEALSDDIAAAIDEFQRLWPGLQRVVLWGLCDGASASLLYLDERRDHRVAGICVANPWIRSPATQARTNVKHYYRERLLQRDFWLKLLRGGVALAALRGLIGNLRQARAATPSGAAGPGFQARMFRGWKALDGPALLLQSGADHTAREFDEFVAMHPPWQALLASSQVERVDLAGADHTFSHSPARRQAEAATVQWLGRLVAAESVGVSGV